MVGQAGFAGSPSTEARFGKRGFQLVPRALRALADRRIVHVTCGHQFTLAVEDGGQVRASAAASRDGSRVCLCGYVRMQWHARG